MLLNRTVFLYVNSSSPKKKSNFMSNDVYCGRQSAIFSKSQAALASLFQRRIQLRTHAQFIIC